MVINEQYSLFNCFSKSEALLCVMSVGIVKYVGDAVLIDKIHNIVEMFRKRCILDCIYIRAWPEQTQHLLQHQHTPVYQKMNVMNVIGILDYFTFFRVCVTLTQNQCN